MKRLYLAALTATVLLTSSNAMAASVSAGTTCNAYYANQETKLKPDWSTLKSTDGVWVHCPGSVSDVTTIGSITFNLTIPVEGGNDVYNCYVATQDDDSVNREVLWIVGSGVGSSVPVEIEVNDNGGGNPTSAPLAEADEDQTLTTGCYLYKGHSLNSSVVD